MHVDYEDSRLNWKQFLMLIFFSLHVSSYVFKILGDILELRIYIEKAITEGQSIEYPCLSKEIG